MIDTSLKVSYSLRFVGIKSEESNALIRSFKREPKSIRPYNKSDSLNVLIFELLEDLDGREAASCLDLVSSSTIVDVFVSVRAYQNSEIIDVPLYVTKFVSESGAELTFSFTVS